MATSADKVWAAILSDAEHVVQRLAAAEASEAVAASASTALINASARLVELPQQPTVPRATWKKLVLEMKVR